MSLEAGNSRYGPGDAADVTAAAAALEDKHATNQEVENRREEKRTSLRYGWAKAEQVVLRVDLIPVGSLFYLETRRIALTADCGHYNLVLSSNTAKPSRFPRLEERALSEIL